MTDPLRALLIEDSESDAALVERMLAKTGSAVECRRVETAEELREMLAAQPWDVVIADYQLPGFSAPQALAILQETGLDIPFIVVSGSIGEDTAVAMMKAGAQDYMMKSNLMRLPPAVVREMADARTRRERLAARQIAQATLDGLSAHICVLAVDGTIIAVNAAWRDFVRERGADPKEATGGSRYLDSIAVLAGCSAEDADALARGLQDVMASRATHSEVECAFHVPAGERWFLVRVTRTAGAGSMYTIVSHTDITARKQAEAAKVALGAKLVESQREAYLQLGQWHRSLEIAKDEERRQLSRELHDEMGQSLTALKLRLKMLARGDAVQTSSATSATSASSASSASNTTKLDDTIAVVDDLIERVRKISVDLRPPLLDELGLEAALLAFLESNLSLSRSKLELHTEELPPRLSPELEMACFRIVQEAITNVLRHAHAAHAVVRVRYTAQSLLVSIVDDGRGVSPETMVARAKAGHLGLVGMRERARALGGELTLSSPPASGERFGTRVDAVLPVSPRAVPSGTGR